MNRAAAIAVLFASGISFSKNTGPILPGSETGNGARAVFIQEPGKSARSELTDFWEAKHPEFERHSPKSLTAEYQMIKSEPVQKWAQGTGKRMRVRQFLNEYEGVLSLLQERTELFYAALRRLDRRKINGDRIVDHFQKDWKIFLNFELTVKNECDRTNDLKKTSLPTIFPVYQAIKTHIYPQGTVCISARFLQTINDRAMLAAAFFHELSYYVGSLWYQHKVSDLIRELTPIVFSKNPKDLEPQNLVSLMVRFVKNQVPNHEPSRWINPGEFLNAYSEIYRLNRDVEYRPAYASELVSKMIDEHWFSKLNGIKTIKNSTEVEKFRCSHGLELHKGLFEGRGLGKEVQFYVVPPVQGAKFRPGFGWHPYFGGVNPVISIQYLKEWKDYRPLPFAMVQFALPTEANAIQAEQIVLVSTNRKEFVWSLGNAIGNCAKDVPIF
jgi:hypothetical protein